MKAYINLTEMVLSNAELFITWAGKHSPSISFCEFAFNSEFELFCSRLSDKETRTEISRPRYGSPYPWPLNHILAFRKQFDVKNHLKAVGWYNKTLDQVYEDVHVGLQVNITNRELSDIFSGT